MLSSNSLLLTFYFVIIDIFFVLSTALFVVVIYCVLKKSKTMGPYKYYMLYTTISSYAFDIVIGIWKPIPLFPIPALASEQFFRDYGSIAGYISFTVCLVAVTHYTLALAMAVTYRYAQIFPGRVQKFVNESPMSLVIFFALHVYYYLVLVLPSILIRLDSFEIAQELSHENISPTFIEEYNVMYFSNKIIKLTIFGGSFDFFGYPLAKLLIFLWLVNYVYSLCNTSIIHVLYTQKSLRLIKTTKSKNSRRLHIMFFKAITSQAALAVFVVMIPAMAIFLMVLFPAELGSSTLGILCFTSISSHAFFEYLCICYFITPYRMFIESVLKRIYRKMTGKSGEENIVPIRREMTVTRIGQLSFASASNFAAQAAKRRATISVTKKQF